MEKITKYWNDNLYNNYQQCDNGVYEYLSARSVPLDFADHYKYGYSSPDGDKEFLFDTYDRYDLLRLGLLIERDDYEYLPFKNRWMFPIRDHSGDVIAFSARQIGVFNKNYGGKYVNSPETKYFNKSRLLYGLYESKKEITKLGYAIIVEGNLDRDRMYLSGIKNVVATCGTSITKYHLETLFLYCSGVYLLMDGDKAGLKSAQRATDLIHEQFPKKVKNLKVAFLPEDKDPDLFILETLKANDPKVTEVKVKMLLKQSKYLSKTVAEKIEYKRVEAPVVSSSDSSNYEEEKKLFASFNIVDIIERQGVKLRKTGANYKANCPFHNEKTASFVVSETKQMYKCFGCGAGGGTATFLKKFNGWSWKESVAYLKGL